MSITPEYAACPWPVDAACFTDEWEALEADVQQRSLALASATLYRLTGYRVGGCPITVRPCKPSCADGGIAYFVGARTWMMPSINSQGMWVNSCGCSTDCACDWVCEIALPGPVGEVYAVTVDTVTLAPDQYRVDGSSLVWTGAGECPWPACQDLTAPVGAEGTFAVEYLNSYPVDAMGAYAAGVLAMEYAKACTGSKGCRLPSSVTAVTRQGVTIEIASGAFPDGFTGIREVDAYISIYNPQALRQQTQVWSPDIKTPRVVR